MTTRIMSDLHFNHAILMNIGKASRPTDYEKRLKHSLSTIKASDTLVVLGDICIGKDAEMHRRYIMPLKCRKVLVLGNHDGKSKARYNSHWRDETHDVLLVTDDLGLPENRWLYILGGRNILLSHQPILELPEGWYNIHWHYHDRQIKPISEFHKLYSPEIENYKPRRIESFIN